MRQSREASIGPDRRGCVRSSLNDEAAITTLDALADGVPTECAATIAGEAESLIVLRDGDDVRAWYNVCPHAGRRLDWAPGEFLRSRDGGLVCAVHGATFELRAGLCVAGPCLGESLRAVALQVRDGQVLPADQ